MPYNRYKEDTHSERPGHIILIFVLVFSLLLMACVCVTLGWYVAECRKQEAEEQLVNFTLEDRGGKSQENITDEDLASIAQALWDADETRLPEDSYAVKPQALVNKSNKADPSPDSFFARIDVDLHDRSDTFLTFLNLLNNFEMRTRIPDVMIATRLQEVDLFLNAVLDTDVMRILQYFLAERGLISENTTSSLRERLFSLWFEPYSRSRKYNVTDSSGFEHVFVGEIKGSKTMGMHSWIQIHFQELYGDLEYMGYLQYHNVNRVYEIQFRWHGKLKKQCSFFLGTSPEFDMAIYTLCSLARTNRECSLYVNQEQLLVRTYDINHIPGLQIGTSFPV